MNDKNYTTLTEVESKKLLQQAGIQVTETRLARSKEDAISISEEIGFPVVLKLVSPDITHKSDAGGVKLRLETTQQVSEAYDAIINSAGQTHPQATIQGVSVQKMAKPGVEIIIGMSQDLQFGPVMMFGLGGIFVEIMKDVTFRVIPLTPADAHDMISEIRGFPLLNGFRGQEPVDIGRLEEFILKVSKFVEDNPDIQELDLNPVFAYSDGAVAVDARVIMATPAAASI